MTGLPDVSAPPYPKDKVYRIYQPHVSHGHNQDPHLVTWLYSWSQTRATTMNHRQAMIHCRFVIVVASQENQGRRSTTRCLLASFHLPISYITQGTSRPRPGFVSLTPALPPSLYFVTTKHEGATRAFGPRKSRLGFRPRLIVALARSAFGLAALALANVQERRNNDVASLSACTSVLSMPKA